MLQALGEHFNTSKQQYRLVNWKLETVRKDSPFSGINTSLCMTHARATTPLHDLWPLKSICFDQAISAIVLSHLRLPTLIRPQSPSIILRRLRTTRLRPQTNWITQLTRITLLHLIAGSVLCCSRSAALIGFVVVGGLGV